MTADAHDYSFHVNNQLTRNDHPQYQLVAGLPTQVVQSLTAGAGITVTGGDGSGHGTLTAAIAVDGTLADIKAVGQSAVVGSAVVAPAADHVHQGVTSITAGSGITITGGDGTHGALTIASLLAGIKSAEIVTNETTTSLSYTDLTTAGPAVTVTTGANALVIVNAILLTSVAGDGALMSCAVSGATTLAAADANACQNNNVQAIVSCAATVISGLTAGSNTFTAKYRANTGGTATFNRRWITVVPLP